MFAKCAKAYLEMLAADIANGARLWAIALRIEQRFRLPGYTVTRVCAIERERRSAERRQQHAALAECPDNWWHRMSPETYRALCAEFGAI